MEGPHDPQHPGHDGGATPPDGQDDLHALLERLLGQGDVRPAAPGAGDDLWPDVFAASAADDVSTIVPAPEAPTAVADHPASDDSGTDAAADEPAARPWAPVVVDHGAASTNVDDIHAAILASVSVELQPIVEAAVAPETPVAHAAPVSEAEPAVIEPSPVADREPVVEAPPVVETGAADTEVFDALAYLEAFTDVETEAPAALDADLEALAFGFIAEPVTAVTESWPEAAPAVAEAPAVEALPGEAPLAETPLADAPLAETPLAEALLAENPLSEAVSVDEPPAEAGFSLTPFEAPAVDAADDAVEAHHDGDAAADLPPVALDLDEAPRLELEPVELPPEEPLSLTGVVLPWPTQEPLADAAPASHDLIEAALAGLHNDLTAEPVEPLRTPDVAASTAHVVFRLGARTMAIPLAAVSEIARPPKVTRLPHVPAWVLGIANLRGDIVSMLDLEGFLSGKAGKASHEQRMLALRPAGDDVRTAVLVDRVDGIKAFEDARVARVTRGYDAEVAPYARGLYQLEDDLVVVIDADRLLQSKPMRQFEDGAGAR